MRRLHGPCSSGIQSANIINAKDVHSLTTPDYYVLSVSSDSDFQSVNYSVVTAGTGAAPTLETPVVP